MTDHDPLCLVVTYVHMDGPCICDELTKARLEERQATADNLWSHIQPVVDWIAGVNATKEDS